jgi:conjugative transposon TraN protein
MKNNLIKEKVMRKIMLLSLVCLSTITVWAQKRYKEIVPDTAKVHYIQRGSVEDAYIFDSDLRKNTVYVNEQVTTHIIMPENIKLVDISTNNIIGNQCADNIVRIKPAGKMYNYELVGTMTVIGERHIAQLNIVYVKGSALANSIYNIDLYDTKRYTNPDVMMPEADMARLAWAIYGTSARFHNIHYKKYGIKAVVNNIYSIDDYFFIDFSLYNNTNIKFDIDEIRVKLTDKKESKATNTQTIELTPVYELNKATSFKKGYRNVIVLNKLTFPDEKILNLEISENQISGRVLYIPIEYSDILHADGFDEHLMKSLSRNR